jgi:hypothetical protein
MRIEDHLLALARIGHEEKCAAVAQPHVRDLHDLIDAAELDISKLYVSGAACSAIRR